MNPKSEGFDPFQSTSMSLHLNRKLISNLTNKQLFQGGRLEVKYCDLKKELLSYKLLFKLCDLSFGASCRGTVKYVHISELISTHCEKKIHFTLCYSNMLN